jgi:hypothetical protein
MVHDDPRYPANQQTNYTGKHKLSTRERLALERIYGPQKERKFFKD